MVEVKGGGLSAEQVKKLLTNNQYIRRSSIMDRLSSRPSRESPKPATNGGTVNVFDRLSAGGKSGSKTSLASSRSDVRASTNNLTAGVRGTTQSR